LKLAQVKFSGLVQDPGWFSANLRLAPVKVRTSFSNFSDSPNSIKASPKNNNYTQEPFPKPHEIDKSNRGGGIEKNKRNLVKMEL
jgi:hypothetical protein